MVARIREHLLEVAGIETPIVESGPGDTTEAVVFVHGNPGPKEVWLPLLAKVGSFARAVAWDHPGFGQAGRPDDFDHTVDGYAAQMDRVMALLGVQRAHLVMHDFGGPWGLRWAVDHPDRFASAVLINSGVLIGHEWHTMAKLWRTPVLGELFVASMPAGLYRRGLDSNEPEPLPSSFHRHVAAGFDKGHRRAVVELYRSVDDVSGASELLAEALAPLDRPALVIWGRHDAYLPERLAEMQRLAFPSAGVHVLDSSGHWPHIHDAATVERMVAGFLEQQVGSTG